LLEAEVPHQAAAGALLEGEGDSEEEGSQEVAAFVLGQWLPVAPWPDRPGSTHRLVIGLPRQ